MGTVCQAISLMVKTLDIGCLYKEGIGCSNICLRRWICIPRPQKEVRGNSFTFFWGGGGIYIGGLSPIKGAR